MNICVYGASSETIDKEYIRIAENLGKLLAARGHSLIFGGGAQGLMGAVSRGALAGGNVEVIGVAPRFFDVEGILEKNCTKFIFTDTMRERKQIMEDSSDAFLVLPGGIGTFEEFFEILTLKQLGRHNKPIVIFNANGYYDEMIGMIKKAVNENFMKPACLEIFSVVDEQEAAIDCIENPTIIDVSHLKNI